MEAKITGLDVDVVHESDAIKRIKGKIYANVHVNKKNEFTSMTFTGMQQIDIETIPVETKKKMLALIQEMEESMNK